MRGAIAGADPEVRSERVGERLEDLPLNARASDIVTLPFAVDGKDGIAFSYHGKILFYLGADDLDKESGQTLPQFAQATLRNLDDALQARSLERSWPVVRSGMLFTLVGLALLLLAVVAIWRAYGWLTLHMRRRKTRWSCRRRSSVRLPHGPAFPAESFRRR